MTQTQEKELTTDVQKTDKITDFQMQNDMQKDVPLCTIFKSSKSQSHLDSYFQIS